MPTTLAQSLRNDRVSNISLRPVCSVEATRSIRDTVQCMTANRTGCALVMRNGALAGIFTERDFISRVMAPGLDVSTPVEQVMTPSPVTSSGQASVQQAIELLETGGYRHLPVLGEDGQPVGVLSVKDVMHYLVEYFPANVYNLPPTPSQTQPSREGA
jgi:CBS domain-containing protein